MLTSTSFLQKNQTREQSHIRALSRCLPNFQFQPISFPSLVLLLLFCSTLLSSPRSSWAESATLPKVDNGGIVETATLSDEELSEVSAGDFDLKDFEMNYNGFDVTLDHNTADRFRFDIAQNAFDSARGVFTTLQAVNSAVDLTVVVNITINGQRF